MGWEDVLSNSGFRDSPDGPGKHFKQLLTQLILGTREVAEIFEMILGLRPCPQLAVGLQVPRPPDTWEAH